MNMIRVATIGSGAIVKSILDGIARTDGIVCQAVYSRTEEKGRALANAYGVDTVYTDLEAMMADPEIDYVYVASPNSLHYTHTMLALQHGKHVLCEKPFSSNVAEAKEMIALAQEKGLFLYEMVTIQYLPNFEALKAQLPRLGNIRLVLSSYSQYSSRYDKLLAGEVTNVFDPAYSGGCMQDINYYNLHFVLSLFGKPEKTVYYSNQVGGIDTSGIAMLQYPGFVCMCSGSKQSEGDNFVQIQGERGYLTVHGASNDIPSFTVHADGKEEHFALQPDGDRWYYEIQNLLPVLQKGDHAACMEKLKLSLLQVEQIEAMRKQENIVFAADQKG